MTDHSIYPCCPKCGRVSTVTQQAGTQGEKWRCSKCRKEFSDPHQKKEKAMNQ